MSSISRRRNGLMALSVIGAPVLGAIFSPSISRQDACFCYSPRPFPCYKLPRERFRWYGADWTVWHRSRAGLLLLNGVVHVAFAARCEDPGKPITSIFHGWILAYDAATLRSVGAFETTADPTPGQTIDGGGIWQGAGGLAPDSDGDIYVTAGNRRGPPYDNSPWDTQNLADSFIRLTPTISRRQNGTVDHVDLRVADSFTPYRKIWLDENDLDLAAAGPVVIPGSRYLFGGGKSGIVYVLDRGNMGRTDLAHYWDAQKLLKVPIDAVQAEWPDDP